MTYTMETREILPGFKAVGLTLHAVGEDALVLADLHLGFEESLNRQGIMVPRFQYKDVVSEVDEALRIARPGKVIICGDLKHEFGSISGQEWAEVMGFLRGLERYEVTIVKGNHDTVVGPIGDKKGVKMVDGLRIGSTLFIHGHEVPGKDSLAGVKTIVMAHEHPCVGLREGDRVEKVKCFLVGRWGRYDLIVLPSMNLVTEGVDVMTEELLSPLLTKGVGEFKAYGVEEGKVLSFGKAKNLH